MQRRHTISTPVWPYIAVVTCLFILSVLAPSLWRASTRVQKNRAAGQRARASSEQIALQSTLRETGGPQQRMPRLDDFDAPRAVATVLPPVTRQVELGPAPTGLPSPPESDPGLRIASRVNLAPRMPRLDSVSLGSIPSASTKKLVERLPASVEGWPFPSALLQQLRQLANQPVARAWSEAVLSQLQELLQSPSHTGAQIEQRFAALETLATNAEKEASAVKDEDLKSQWLRARYALLRRVLVWRQVNSIMTSGADTYSVSLADAGEVTRWLDAVDRRLGKSQAGSEWRRYLYLDELRLALGAGEGTEQKRIARAILARMASHQLSNHQSGFLQDASFEGFSLAMRGLCGEPVDYLRIVEDLELYEETRSTGSASQLASCYQVIRWSNNDHVRQLADTVNTYYRNANLRVAVSAELLNRLLPNISTEDDVRDTVLNARVRGRSRTSGRLHVVLTPDPRCWNVGIEARGEVDSRTSAERGPATFYSNGRSRDLARKSVMVDREGVHTDAAEVAARTNMDLNGVETDFDSVPLLGWLARAVALEQHDRNSEEARRITSARIRNMASDRMDDEVQRQIADVEEEFEKKWLSPLRSLHLQPVALDMQTTTDELLVRYRLAAEGQLGAHTPRPEAPRGSLLNVQIHESALNNTLEQLHLEGKAFEVRALYTQLAQAFQREEVSLPEDLPDDIVVQFADRNAVRVRCDDNRLTLTLRIAELKRGNRKKWRNFAVRAYYTPDVSRLDARLVRDGGLEVAGNQRDLELIGIFARALSRNQPVRLVKSDLADDPRLADVRVSQFVLTDGWIGVSLSAGPEGTAATLRTADCCAK